MRMKLSTCKMMEVEKRDTEEENKSNICVADKSYVVANTCQNSPRE
jgi:hypothetical protein